MSNVSLEALLILLIILICISAFFSASETGMMAINRYRLKHLERENNKSAKRVANMLERPDRLLGVILIGNTFANILASAIATVIAQKLYGDVGIAIGTLLLTMVILIFAEIGPKTIAATYPQATAFAASLPLKIILKILYPFVWLANLVVNSILRIFRIHLKKNVIEQLTAEELHTIVQEAGETIPEEHQDMLLAVLSLEKLTVDDVMIPRADIIGVDLNNDWPEIIKAINDSHHTRIPIYEDDINNVKGMINVRSALNLLSENKLTKESLIEIAEDVIFIPESAPMLNQLLQFRNSKKKLALIVDEYGDVLGLVTLADMLEEIVGEFTMKRGSAYKGIQEQVDGSVLVDASINIRDLNRHMDWHFDTSGPKTLSGLITEYLEVIPQTNLCLRISGYPIEIVEITANTVKIAKVYPGLKV